MMTSRARILSHWCALLALLSASHAQAQSPSPTSKDAVSITQVIAGAAKKTGKKFVVDPRVTGEVTVIGLDAEGLDYPTLLSVLQVHGFAAVDDGNYVRVVPDANARQLAIPVLTGGGSYANAEYVSRVLSIKSVPAAMLVPILRPLLPQQSHLVALPCTNNLLLVDTYGNVKRLEKIVNTLDKGEPYKPEKCGAPPAAKAD
jgi:general secretion pathway protein D